MPVLIDPGGEISVTLQWNDPFGGSGNDYDLSLWNNTVTVMLAESNDLQDGNDNPIEQLTYTNLTAFSQTVRVAVARTSGASRRIEMFVLSRPDAEVVQFVVPEGSVFGHAAVPDVLAVGAIASDDPGNDTIRDFSSRGPSQIFFPAPQVRPKPDLAAIDKVSVTGAGGFPSAHQSFAEANRFRCATQFLRSGVPVHPKLYSRLRPGRLRQTGARIVAGVPRSFQGDLFSGNPV